MPREGARLVQQHQTSDSIQNKINWPVAGPNQLQVAKTKVIYSQFSLLFLFKRKLYQPKYPVTQNCEQKN